MSLVVKNILENSLVYHTEIEINNRIISINNHPIKDFIDLQYYGADPVLEIIFRDKFGKNKTIVIEQDWETSLGIEPEDHKCRTCINRCIFCFVDQMRPDLRKSLIFKDDDFRFSFVFGNFVTLTNFSEADYQKIFEQKLSPLYISVHTTNPTLHKRMLRYTIKDFDIMQKLQYLSDNNIEFHTQIVVIPGWNDKSEFIRTLDDLSSPDLNTLSIGIVPIGITKFRDNLTEIDKVDYATANELIDASSKYENAFCSDEIYLLAKREIPDDEFYQDYPQLENGIGMIRMFWENWNDVKDDFILEMNKLGKEIVFVTGALFYDNLKKLSDEINLVSHIKSRVVKVINNFLGKTVTVAGLLTAQDILSQVKIGKNEIVALSSNVFNTEDITLDNITKYELKKRLQTSLMVIDEEFADWEYFSL